MYLFHIVHITKKKWVIYYPELAYFSPNFKKLVSKKELEAFLLSQKEILLLLSLFFDLILIPPEHFVRTGIGSKLFNDPDLRVLFESGIIITTHWENYNDPKTFLECLQEYFAEIGQKYVINEQSSKDLIKITYFLRSVTNQSEWLLNKLLEFIQINKERILNLYSNEAFDQLLNIIRKSNYKDILPFSHEKFWFLLIQEKNIPTQLKEEIWNKSCSLYYNAGVEWNYCIRYPIFEIDQNNFLTFREINFVFFLPDFLKIFLIVCGLSKKEVENLKFISGLSILKLRNESKELWNNFREIYFNLVKTISRQIEELEKKYNILFNSRPNVEVFKKIFTNVLIFRTKNDIIENFLYILFEIITMLFEIPSLSYIGEKLKIYEKIESKLILWKYKELKNFIELLKNILKYY